MGTHGSRDKKLRVHILSMNKNQRIKRKGHEASTCTICSLTSSSKASSLDLPQQQHHLGPSVQMPKTMGSFFLLLPQEGMLYSISFCQLWLTFEFTSLNHPTVFFLMKLFRRVVCTDGDVPVLRFHSLFIPVSSSTARSWYPYLLSLTS